VKERFKIYEHLNGRLATGLVRLEWNRKKNNEEKTHHLKIRTGEVRGVDLLIHLEPKVMTASSKSKGDGRQTGGERGGIGRPTVTLKTQRLKLRIKSKWGAKSSLDTRRKN